MSLTSSRIGTVFAATLLLGVACSCNREPAPSPSAKGNAAPDGKRVVVNFSMPRQSVVDMIKKQMEPGV